MKFLAQQTITFLTLCLLTSAGIEGKKHRSRTHWEDQIVPNTYVVSNTNPSGPGSLQRALEKTRISSDVPSEISFNIPLSDPGYNPATGTYVIKLEKTLEIFSDTLIDGFTQKGASHNCQNLAYPDNSILTIEIQPKVSFQESGDHQFGDTLVFAKGSANSRLKGVIVHGSPVIASGHEEGTFYPAAIRVLGNEHVIEGCLVGVQADGESSDSTIIAIAVEGNNNVIGDERFSHRAGSDPRPSTRMIIGGSGVSAHQDIPAVLITGKGNRIVNGQLGIRKSGSGVLDHNAATGLLASLITSAKSSDNREPDLIIDTFAAAGSEHIVFDLMNFNTIHFVNVSAGTNPNRTSGLGGGIGLRARNTSEAIINEAADEEGNLMISHSLFSGLTTGILLGNAQEDLFAGPQLNEVTIQNSHIGTDGAGSSPISNTYGATSQGIRTLKVSDNTISGNLTVGWQHKTSATHPANTALFSSNYIGIATPPTLQSIPNAIGISIVGTGPVMLQKNLIEYNGHAIVASRNAQLTMKNNTIKHNSKAHTVYKAWHKLIK